MDGDIEITFAAGQRSMNDGNFLVQVDICGIGGEAAI